VLFWESPEPLVPASLGALCGDSLGVLFWEPPEPMVSAPLGGLFWGSSEGLASRARAFAPDAMTQPDLRPLQPTVLTRAAVPRPKSLTVVEVPVTD